MGNDGGAWLRNSTQYHASEFTRTSPSPSNHAAVEAPMVSMIAAVAACRARARAEVAPGLHARWPTSGEEHLHDSQATQRTISPLFTKEGPEDGQAPEPGHVRHTRRGREARTSRPVLQARLSSSAASGAPPARAALTYLGV